MLITSTKLKVPNGKRQEILQTIRSLSKLKLDENGCLGYGIYQEIDRENEYCLLEKWSSWRSFRKYLLSDRFKILMGAMSLLEETPEIHFSSVCRENEADQLVSHLNEMINSFR